MGSATFEQSPADNSHVPAEKSHALSGCDQLARQKRVQRVAEAMDSAFRIPLTRRRIGIDSLVGLIPGVGDLATTAASAYIVWEANKIGVPKRTMLRMVWNIAVDSAIGVIPVLGDLFDVAFKANLRNAGLIEKHLRDRDKAKGQCTRHF